MSVDEKGLGRLTRVDPREVWKNEARDLTPWLLDNIEVLAEALQTDIVPSQREVRIGDFFLDVLGEDSSGRPVIIENQLDGTNHSHLGQLLVYASGLDAAVVIWMTPRFREEHRRALDWLNERTDETVHFFGVELDLVRIGESAPAPIFRVVARPNEWQKAVRREASGGISELNQQRHDFFESFMDDLAVAKPGFRKVKAPYQHWIQFGAGQFGYYVLSFAAGDRLRSEIYIDMGDQDPNKKLFDELLADAEAIERQLGFSLEWERLEQRRASRLAVYRSAPNLADPTSSAEARRWGVEHIIKMMTLDQRLRERARQLRQRAI